VKFKAFILDTISQIKSQFSTLISWLKEHRERLRVKGKAHFTILIVPQSEHKSLRWSISYRAITLIIGGFLGVTFLSAFIVLQSSTREHEIYELQFSNEDFIVQSQKLRKELRALHEVTNQYYEKTANLYLQLGGDSKKVYPLFEKDSFALLEPETDIFPESYRLQTDIYNLQSANELIKEITKIIRSRKNLVETIPSIWPTRGYILMPYGRYVSPITGQEFINYGVDIGTFPGSEVLVTASGQVYEIGFSSLVGYYVKVMHKYGWKTIYSNLERLQVKKGQEVSKGDIIGYVTKTLINPIYHLHYEVHVGTKPLNPYSFLNKIQN